MARKLARYLRWLGVKTAIFNVGQYRRNYAGAKLPHGYFDPENTAYVEARVKIANVALGDLIRWLHSGGQVAIYDAANTTEARRRELVAMLTEAKVQVIFMEAICDRADVVEANIREVKITSPDYTGIPAEEAIADFVKRIEWYRSSYTSISDPALSYIQMHNVGEHIIVNRIKGYLQSRIVYYLTNLHICPRRIFLTRHGEGTSREYRTDPGLSESGKAFTHQLRLFLETQGKATGRDIVVWTSVRKRSCETLDILDFPCEQKAHLAELNRGVVDGLSELEIQTRFPQEYVRSMKDPYHHRFPRGESYLDLAIRLENVILELERHKGDVMIVAHETVLKCLYAYYADRPENESPFISLPRHTVVEIVPRAYGYHESRYFVYPIQVPGEDSHSPIFVNEFRPFVDSLPQS